MALFPTKWLRRIIRRHTNPMAVDYATMWSNRLSIAYAILAWNALGFICYLFYTGRGDWAKKYKTEEELKMTPAQYFSKHLNVEKGKIIRFKGFTRTGEESFDNTQEKTE